jgi:ATP-dependent Clp protease ATP-binding subunit ClpA
MILSEEVEAVLHRAFVAAREAGHEQIAPEHLALELIVEDEVSTYLARCGTDLVAVESRLRAHLGSIEPNGEGEVDAQPAPALERIIDAAVQRTEADGREYLMLRDLFVAVIDARHSTASAAIVEATREPQVFDELRTYRSIEERGATRG